MRVKMLKDIKNLAVIAHDLKAPISAVIDLLSVIEKGYVDDPNKVRELISRARQKSETLIKMVEDILDYTMLEGTSEMKRDWIFSVSLKNQSLLSDLMQKIETYH